MQLIEMMNEEFRKRRQRILDMKLSGMSVADIARAEGVTPARIYQILNKVQLEVVASDTLPHPADAKPVTRHYVRRVQNG